jgi:hypothetical protein
MPKLKGIPAYSLGKNSVRSLAYRYLRKGKSPPPCEKCGSTNHIEMHHRDYAKPFDVQFFCRPCHRALHRKGATSPLTGATIGV